MANQISRLMSQFVLPESKMSKELVVQFGEEWKCGCYLYRFYNKFYSLSKTITTKSIMLC